MSNQRSTRLAGPEAALASYLDDLLHTATHTTTEEDRPEPAESPAIPELKVVAPAPAPEPVPAPEPTTTPVPEVGPALPEKVKTPAHEERRMAEPPEATVPPLRPEWSERPFECLIFRVAGLQLAVPLVLLGAIHRLEQKVKPIPGRPRWYMGMLPDRESNLRVVDTAEWIMSGRVPAGAREGYQFVIRLDNSEWALACDDVAQSFTLNPDEVRWRSARSKRPWLAGTVVQHMCALIDVSTMAGLLARAEKEQKLDLE